MCRFGRPCTSLSTNVVLPVPDGAETMNSRPRALLDILDLLTHLLELGFRVDDQFRDVEAIGLRAKCVHFTVHLLDQEIQLAPARLLAVGERLPVRQVRAKAG